MLLQNRRSSPIILSSSKHTYQVRCASLLLISEIQSYTINSVTKGNFEINFISDSSSIRLYMSRATDRIRSPGMVWVILHLPTLYATSRRHPCLLFKGSRIGALRELRPNGIFLLCFSNTINFAIYWAKTK